MSIENIKSPHDIPQKATVTIQPVGSTIIATDRFGHRIFNDDQFARLWANVIASIPAPSRSHPERILTKGFIRHNGKCMVPNFLTVEIDGRHYLSNGVNDNMFELDSNEPLGITFEGGGILDGNLANQTAQPCNGIYGEQTVATPQTPVCRIRHLQIVKTFDNPVRIINTSAYSTYWLLHDLLLLTDYRCGLWMEGMTDINLDLVQAGGYIADFRFGNDATHACANIMANNIYGVGGGMRLYGNNFQMNNVFLDSGDDRVICRLEGCYRSNFTNINIRKVDNANSNKNPAIKLSVNAATDCTQNTFSSINIYSKVAAVFKWGIEETDANQDNNVYGVVNAPAISATNAVRMLGANSKPTLGNEHLINGAVVRV